MFQFPWSASFSFSPKIRVLLLWRYLFSHKLETETNMIIHFIIWSHVLYLTILSVYWSVSFTHLKVVVVLRLQIQLYPIFPNLLKFIKLNFVSSDTHLITLDYLIFQMCLESVTWVNCFYTKGKYLIPLLVKLILTPMSSNFKTHLIVLFLCLFVRL